MAGERIDQTASDTKRRMWVLRVGVIPKGERAPKCTAINNNEEEPPGMNNAMWKAKINIAAKLKYLGMTMMMNPNDYNNVISVEKWVLMKQVRKAAVKRKCYNNNDNTTVTGEGIDPSIVTPPPIKSLSKVFHL